MNLQDERVRPSGLEIHRTHEPPVDLGQGLGHEPVPAALGVLSDRHEPRLAQHLEVLRHGGLGEGQVVGEVADPALAAPEQLEDVPTSGLGDGVEDGLHGGHYSIVGILPSRNGTPSFVVVGPRAPRRPEAGGRGASLRPG